MSADIGSKIKSGAFYTYLQGWAGGAIHFVVGIILARILELDDFGVFFAVSAYTALMLRQVQFGIPEALLQAIELEERHWNAAFWFMFLLATALVGIIAAASGWLSKFYGDDRYQPLMLWLLVPFLLSPYATICTTILRRAMDYKTLARVNMSVVIFCVPVSIGAALLGFGAYTFVITGIFGAILTAALAGRAAKWQPSWPIRMTALGGLWRYGWRMHINSTLYLAASQIDSMIIGRMIGMQELGIYRRAFSLSILPVEQLLTRLYQVLFSGLSRVQSDLERSIAIQEKVLCALTSAIFPLLLIMMFIAEGFIRILYGDKWLPAVFPLQIMVIGSFAVTISICLGALSDAQGLVGKEIPIAAADLGLTIAAVVIGTRWGLVGVAIGIAAKGFVVLSLLQRMLKRSHLGLSWFSLIRSVSPSLFCCAVAASVAAGLAQISAGSLDKGQIAYVLMAGTMISVVYAATWLLLARLLSNHEPLQACVDLLTALQSNFRRAKVA